MDRNERGVGNLATVRKPLRDQLVPLSGALKSTPDLEETYFRERENRDCKMNSGLQKLTWRIKKEAEMLKKLFFAKLKSILISRFYFFDPESFKKNHFFVFLKKKHVFLNRNQSIFANSKS